MVLTACFDCSRLYGLIRLGMSCAAMCLSKSHASRRAVTLVSLLCSQVASRCTSSGHLCEVPAAAALLARPDPYWKSSYSTESVSVAALYRSSS